MYYTIRVYHRPGINCRVTKTSKALVFAQNSQCSTQAGTVLLEEQELGKLKAWKPEGPELKD